jgi:hypothetical protein
MLYIQGDLEEQNIYIFGCDFIGHCGGKSLMNFSPQNALYIE